MKILALLKIFGSALLSLWTTLVLIVALVACFAETQWGQRAEDLRYKQPKSAYSKQVAFSAEEEEE